MKINASEIRVGMLLEYKNDLWQVQIWMKRNLYPENLNGY